MKKAKEKASPPANEVRGELSITLDDAEFVLRPSYEAILEFEDATGKALTNLAFQAASAKLSIREMSIIVASCIRAWGRAVGNTSAAGVNERRIGELIIEAGAFDVRERITELLTRAATGGVNAQGETTALIGTPTTEQTPGAD